MKTNTHTASDSLNETPNNIDDGFTMICNNHQDIRNTNYWKSGMAKHGKFLVSFNAGCFRVLLPKQYERYIPDMLKNCEYAILTRVKKPSINRLVLEILLENHTICPPVFLTSMEGIAVIFPLVEGKIMEHTLSLWIEEGGRPKKVAEMKAYYRQTNTLPYLQPL